MNFSHCHPSFDQFLLELDQLVRIDSTSPLSSTAIEHISEFLTPWGFTRHDQFWTRLHQTSDLWIYMHIDTKPVGDEQAWSTPPFALTQVKDRLFGRGVSDAKFQLLNGLHSFAQAPVNMIIDGAEECEGTQAGNFLALNKVRRLIIVDGSAEETGQIFGGLRGQIDGSVVLETGQEPLHPGRVSHTEIITQLGDMQTLMKGQHFNLTRIHGGDPIRSLTLEQVLLGFDLRFIEEQEQIQKFLKKYKPQIRQYFPPVIGSDSIKRRPIAPFSNPIGMSATKFDTVWVLPGGRADNRAHRPNENISIRQIGEHRALLDGFAAAGFDVQ
ncbi:M20/M25/M40 family metallo-hydrolase (plasmid) [Rhizobium sp. CB3171]|uniref:M20/M25/M40 family metallo-hydrolase n=1 Tax=Rhizobium sp. CB3171 TaxID=3039157 RepID=UPI0024B254B3|nr:M20/M25/M40 family metallo-hydrolase [Rhizobium sp. CB3171]WFU04538.1 M20/M25/M40 family metallo-hydrolase [Rhizobium sp. CB3171]